MLFFWIYVPPSLTIGHSKVAILFTILKVAKNPPHSIKILRLIGDGKYWPEKGPSPLPILSTDLTGPKPWTPWPKSPTRLGKKLGRRDALALCPLQAAGTSPCQWRERVASKERRDEIPPAFASKAATSELLPTVPMPGCPLEAAPIVSPAKWGGEPSPARLLPQSHAPSAATSTTVPQL